MSRLSTFDIADRLHSVAIHLLRRLRRQDDESTLPAPQLSTLSVLVFAGAALTLGELATAEQVRPPTVTRLVAALEAQQLVVRAQDSNDARITRITATPKGARLLHEGRLRRVAALTEAMRQLSPRERAIVADALPILERLARADTK
jgi:DNA-binding MarR family transcriptional regulator